MNAYTNLLIPFSTSHRSPLRKLEDWWRIYIFRKACSFGQNQLTWKTSKEGASVQQTGLLCSKFTPGCHPNQFHSLSGNCKYAPHLVETNWYSWSIIKRWGFSSTNRVALFQVHSQLSSKSIPLIGRKLVQCPLNRLLLMLFHLSRFLLVKRSHVISTKRTILLPHLSYSGICLLLEAVSVRISLTIQPLNMCFSFGNQ